MTVRVELIEPTTHFKEGEVAKNAMPSSFFRGFEFRDETGREIVGSRVLTSVKRAFIQEGELWYEVAGARCENTLSEPSLSTGETLTLS